MLQTFTNIFIFLINPFRSILSFIKAKMRYHKVLSFTYGATIGKGSSFEGCNTIGDNSHYTGKMGYGSYMSSNCESYKGRSLCCLYDESYRQWYYILQKNCPCQSWHHR